MTSRAAALRCKDPRITASVLDRAIDNYERYFAGLTDYDVHLRWWIARYSRGDRFEDLRDAFSLVTEKVEATGKLKRAQYGESYRLFGYDPSAIGLFRDGLVLLSLGLCLRAPAAQVDRVLGCCQRGDPLIETLARAAHASQAADPGAPAFPDEFDGLYAALSEPPERRPAVIADYLSVWLDQRMDGFGFKVSDREICYWCFEAAGVVAALGIEDRGFADHPHYPRDLVAFYRARPDRNR